MGKLPEGIYVGGHWELSSSYFPFIIDIRSNQTVSIIFLGFLKMLESIHRIVYLLTSYD